MTKVIVELIFASDCPNVELARQNLNQALTALGSRAQWQEWERDSERTPPHARGYGSPTILVNGRDVAGFRGGQENCCRLYPHGNGSVEGAPSVEIILEALLGRRPSTEA